MHRGLHSERISTLTFMWDLAGVDFSGFSRELVRTVLGPVSDVGFDSAVRPRAAVASPPKSISVTPRLLDRCHRSCRDLLVRVNISRCSQCARSLGIRSWHYFRNYIYVHFIPRENNNGHSFLSFFKQANI